MKSVVVGALLLAFSLTASADTGFDSVQIDNNACTLTQSGSRNKDVVWEGTKQFGYCSVRVSTRDFSRRYKHCSISGIVTLGKGGGDCQFGYYDEAKSIVFFKSSEENVCHFVCVREN
jgi:hypothetical protein